MAQITLTFDSYEELVSFSEKLLSGEGGMETSAVSTAVPATEVKQAESYGQQIAPHFPEANTSAQLNQQALNQVTQSVAPTQAVPTAAPTYTREDQLINSPADASTPLSYVLYELLIVIFTSVASTASKSILQEPPCPTSASVSSLTVCQSTSPFLTSTLISLNLPLAPVPFT